MEKRIFLDASFWIALRDHREPAHSGARRRLKAVLADRALLVFTSLVLAEVVAYVSRSPRLRLQVLDDAERNPVMLWEPVSRQDEAAALKLLRTHHDKSYSFCDAVSFALMERLGVRRALSFDDHFRQYGKFEVVSSLE